MEVIKEKLDSSVSLAQLLSNDTSIEEPSNPSGESRLRFNIIYPEVPEEDPCFYCFLKAGRDRDWVLSSKSPSIESVHVVESLSA